MKRISIAILALLYLAVSSGIAINIHYCMGKVYSVDLFSASDKCDKCGMKKVPGCCNDKFKIVKLDDAHKLISSDVSSIVPVAIINNPARLFDADLRFPCLISDSNNHSPPKLSETSLCILYSVFRI